MRHADVYDHAGGEKFLYGNLDGFWLSQLGIRQATDTADYIKEELKLPLDIIIHSPLERTFQTARIVADRNSAKPKMIPEMDIRDIGVFPWQGKLPREEWTKNRRKYFEMQMKQEINGLEHPKKIQKRMVKSFNEYTEKYPNKNLLFVSHGDPICYLFQYFNGEELEPLVFYHMGVNKAALFEVHMNNSTPLVKKLYEPEECGTHYPKINHTKIQEEK